MTTQTIGFIGLGRMGGPMTARLVNAGERVIGFDAAGTAARLPAGAEGADSVAELAARTETVFLSLPDGPISEAVCAQIAAAEPRATRTVVNLSTVGVESAQRCERVLQPGGVGYLDAPVSGGVAGARNGTLSIMVGGDAARLESVQPLLAVLSKRTFHVGTETGQGQAMKLLNNYASAAALAATSEAVVFGVRMGLDLVQMVEVLNASTGSSSASTDKFPRSIVPRTYDYGFAAAMMTKDVRLYRESAEAAGSPHELADTLTRVWEQFLEAEPQADFTAIHRYLEQRPTE